MDEPKPSPKAEPRRLRIGLMPSHLRVLSAGHAIEVGWGDLIVELVPREEITGFCHVYWTRRRYVLLEWRAAENAENIKTVQKYLDAGAYFYRHGFEIDRTTNLPVIEPITDPQQIVRLETSARCWWETSKNRDKPSPHNPR